jgi:periplasmic copper chaperone A
MRALIITLLFFSITTFAAAASPFVVTSGQVRQPLPGRTVTVGYFTLQNNSQQEVSLISVTSAAFKRVELHQHSHNDGMMRMEQVTQISISAGESIELAPGGLHLMLFEPLVALEIGQMVTVLLHFTDGQALTVTLPVVAMPKR